MTETELAALRTTVLGHAAAFEQAEAPTLAQYCSDLGTTPVADLDHPQYWRGTQPEIACGYLAAVVVLIAALDPEANAIELERGLSGPEANAIELGRLTAVRLKLERGLSGPDACSTALHITVTDTDISALWNALIWAQVAYRDADADCIRLASGLPDSAHRDPYSAKGRDAAAQVRRDALGPYLAALGDWRAVLDPEAAPYREIHEEWLELRRLSRLALQA